MAPTPQLDTATTVLGGVIVLTCTLAVVFTGFFFGSLACVVMFVVVLFLLDEEMSMAAWTFCQSIATALLRASGMLQQQQQQQQMWQESDE